MLRISRETKIFGILGYPLSHSLSPLMHNQAMTYMGYDGVYLPLPCEDLETAVKAIRVFGFKGVNVTIPHKERVIEYIDDLSESAWDCGAVNLVVNEDGRLVGHNTDGDGFLASLAEKGCSWEGRKCTILGYGGAARAALFSLARRGAGLLNVVGRDAARAEGLAREVTARTGTPARAFAFADLPHEVLRTSDILVNSTPVGMYPRQDEMVPLDLTSLPWDCTVVDMVYNPPRTRLLAEAEERGLNTINGLGMLVYQGARSFELLTGEDAPVNIMKEVVEDYFR